MIKPKKNMIRKKSIMKKYKYLILMIIFSGDCAFSSDSSLAGAQVMNHLQPRVENLERYPEVLRQLTLHNERFNTFVSVSQRIIRQGIESFGNIPDTRRWAEQQSMALYEDRQNILTITRRLIGENTRLENHIVALLLTIKNFRGFSPQEEILLSDVKGELSRQVSTFADRAFQNYNERIHTLKQIYLSSLILGEKHSSLSDRGQYIAAMQALINNISGNNPRFRSYEAQLKENENDLACGQLIQHCTERPSETEKPIWYTKFWQDVSTVIASYHQLKTPESQSGKVATYQHLIQIILENRQRVCEPALWGRMGLDTMENILNNCPEPGRGDSEYRKYLRKLRINIGHLAISMQNQLTEEDTTRIGKEVDKALSYDKGIAPRIVASALKETKISRNHQEENEDVVQDQQDIQKLLKEIDVIRKIKQQKRKHQLTDPVVSIPKEQQHRRGHLLSKSASDPEMREREKRLRRKYKPESDTSDDGERTPHRQPRAEHSSIVTNQDGYETPSSPENDEDDIPYSVRYSSRKSVEDQQKIGAREIPGWILQDVPGDGNCFYYAVEHQMRQLNLQIPITNGTCIADALRLRVQGEYFQDQEWADNHHIETFVRTFNTILAVIDTRYVSAGFTYYYHDENEHNITNRGDMPLPPNKPLLKLAYTGNHFLSVVNHPSGIVH
jgi:hypothetical protein